MKLLGLGFPDSMDFEKKRIQVLLFVVGIIALSITADKCRQLVGEEAASKSGKFTFLNCFDGSSGTLACVVKEGVKLYFYNIRGAHVERARHQAIEKTLVDALSQGLTATDAAKQAQKEGKKAAKLATRQAKRIIGPIISSGWDFFEAVYYGGTITEGFLRGTGTLFGTYVVGFLGEERFGRLGYLVGSELGSWVGGRIGLMVYDIVNGVHFLVQFSQPEETKVHKSPAFESSERDESKDYETSAFESSEAEETKADAAPAFESFGYLLGSKLGSWVGEKIGLKGNDVVNVVQFLLQFIQPEETKVNESPAFESSDVDETKVYETSAFGSSEAEETKVYEAPAFESAEASQYSYVHETPTDTISEASEDSNIDESPPYESSEAHEDF